RIERDSHRELADGLVVIVFQQVLTTGFQMLFRRRLRSVALNRLVVRVFDARDTGTLKPRGIFLRHAMNLVSIVTAAKQSAEHLEGRGQHLDDLVALLLLLIGVTY